jgi:site-specific DNA recombinase
VQDAGGTDACTEHGWRIVRKVHDDGISRAEFVKRHGLNEIVRDAKKGACKLVVLRDSSRMGGDMLRTVALLTELHEVGCAVFYYRDKQLVQLDTSDDRMMASFKGYVDEKERERISDRTVENLQDRAKRGDVTQGAPYGYRTVDKRLVVNEAEATVVIRIFQDYAHGHGLRQIVTALNTEAVPPPQRSGERSATSWSRQTVRGLLTRTRYIGYTTHGLSEKIYRGGTKVRRTRPEADVLTVVTPRIIAQDLWDAVQAKLAKNPVYGNAVSRKGRAPKYLLVGIARCRQCGGPVYGHRHSYRGQARTAYVCGRYRASGTTACTNNSMINIKHVDGQLAQSLQQLITPQLISDVFAGVRRIVESKLDKAPDERVAFEKEAVKLRQELARLTNALAATDSAEPLVAAISERNARLKMVEQKLAVAPAAAELVRDSLADLEIATRNALANLAEVFAADPTRAREFLQALVVGKISLDRDKLEASCGILGVLSLPNIALPRSRESTVWKELWAVISPEDVPVVHLRVPLRLAA